MKDIPALEWHPFAERFPLLEGAEWETFKADVKTTDGNTKPIEFRMKGGKRQGLDGRNRERACRELGLKPTYKLVSVKDDEVELYIARANIFRRHQDIESRRAIVAVLRAAGKSVRAIADEVKASPATVLRDLKEEGQVFHDETPDSEKPAKNEGSPPPKPATVTGKDGKTYPASKPAGPVLCARCQRAQPGVGIEGCGECRRLRNGTAEPANGTAPKKAPKKQPPPRPELKDALGTVLPDSCRDAFADPALPELIEELELVEGQLRPEPWARKAGGLTRHYPFLLAAKFDEHVYEALHRVQVALEALRAGVPHAVCPKCNGADSNRDGKVCKGCRGCGHVPEHRYEELTK